MKVFLATLLIIGFAAAVPSPKSILDDLKAKLQQDVKDIQAHTEQAVQQISDDAKKGIAALIKNPITGLGPLVKDLSNDIKNVVTTSISDSKNVIEHIQTAINALSEVDATPLRQILDNLKNELKGDVKDMRASAHQLLKQVLSHAGDGAKALITDPANASKIIKENWNTDYNQLMADSNQFVATVQKQIQNAIDQINEQYKQQ